MSGPGAMIGNWVTMLNVIETKSAGCGSTGADRQGQAVSISRPSGVDLEAAFAAQDAANKIGLAVSEWQPDSTVTDF